MLVHRTGLTATSGSAQRCCGVSESACVSPRASVLLLFQEQEKMPVTHRICFPKTGVLLPPLGVRHKGWVQLGRYCLSWYSRRGHRVVTSSFYSCLSLISRALMKAKDLKQVRFIWSHPDPQPAQDPYPHLVFKGYFFKSGFKRWRWCRSIKFPGSAVQQCNESHLSEAFTAIKMLHCYMHYCRCGVNLREGNHVVLKPH